MKQEKKSIIIAECRKFDFKITHLDFDLNLSIVKQNKLK